MPINDVGYRRLKNDGNSSLFRWLAICNIGVRLALKSKWVKRIMLSAWLPVTYWAVGFFFVEKASLPYKTCITFFCNLLFGRRYFANVGKLV